MARFLKHIGCDKCGSSDAKAIYSDNSTYCFRQIWTTALKEGKL